MNTFQICMFFFLFTWFGTSTVFTLWSIRKDVRDLRDFYECLVKVITEDMCRKPKEVPGDE